MLMSMEVRVGRLLTVVMCLGLGLGAVGAPRPGIAGATPLSREAAPAHVAVIGDSYTTGTDEGGQGAKGWAARTWQSLARQGVAIAPDVAAEGGAGYGARGNHGSVFIDLAARAVHRDDALVAFYGSRNDQPVDPARLAVLARNAFVLARRTAPAARLLVIGPPWPTPNVPPVVLRIRDVLRTQALAAGATFFDPIVAGWFFGRSDLIGPDGVHPTDAGHAYMADRIAPLISSQLPRST
jgi:lysophospholipase L1-like esterase